MGCTSTQGMSLVDYPSDEEDGARASGMSPAASTAGRGALPAPIFTNGTGGATSRRAAPDSEAVRPSKRARTFPPVVGNWPTHVYIRLAVTDGEDFKDMMDGLAAALRAALPPSAEGKGGCGAAYLRWCAEDPQKRLDHPTAHF